MIAKSLQDLPLTHSGPGHAGRHRVALLRGVLHPELDRVEVEFASELVEDRFDDERRLGSERRAVGADGRLVRRDLEAAHRLVRGLVGAAQQGSGEGGHRRREAAAVDRQLGLERGELPAPLRSGANRDPGRGGRSRRQHLFGPGHHQADRSLVLNGRKREKGFVEHELGAETASDRSADDLDLVLRQADHAGDRVPDEEGRLGGAVDGHPGPHGVGVDQGGVRLDVRLVDGRRAEHALNDRVRFGETGGEVTALKAHRVRHVGRRGRRVLLLRHVARPVRGCLLGLTG